MRIQKLGVLSGTRLWSFRTLRFVLLFMVGFTLAGCEQSYPVRLGPDFARAPMASHSIIYDALFVAGFHGLIDIRRGHFRCMLVAEPETPFAVVHGLRSDIETEVHGKGYKAGGRPCDLSEYIDGAAYCIAISQVEWLHSTITAAGMVVYEDLPDARDGVLVSYIDFGSKVSTFNATYRVTVTSPLKIGMGQPSRPEDSL